MMVSERIAADNFKLLFKDLQLSHKYKIKINNQISLKSYTKKAADKLIDSLINFPNLDIEIIEVAANAN